MGLALAEAAAAVVGLLAAVAMALAPADAAVVPVAVRGAVGVLGVAAGSALQVVAIVVDLAARVLVGQVVAASPEMSPVIVGRNAFQGRAVEGPHSIARRHQVARHQRALVLEPVHDLAVRSDRLVPVARAARTAATIAIVIFAPRVVARTAALALAARGARDRVPGGQTTRAEVRAVPRSAHVGAPPLSARAGQVGNPTRRPRRRGVGPDRARRNVVATSVDRSHRRFASAPP
jgi:hypothetical protein